MSADNIQPELRETGDQAEQLAQTRRGKNMMMNLVIFVVIMMFAAWSSGYIVMMNTGFWATFTIPSAFDISTMIILLCSVAWVAALFFAKRGKSSAMIGALVAVLVLGGAFTVSQFKGWEQLKDNGNRVTAGLLHVQGEYGQDYLFYYKGEALLEENGQYYMAADSNKEYALNDELAAARNTASSFFYVLTGVHFLHVLLGIGLLLYVLIRALKGRYGAHNSQAVKLVGRYWHFMGGLWIYILLFLHFIH